VPSVHQVEKYRGRLEGAKEAAVLKSSTKVNEFKSTVAGNEDELAVTALCDMRSTDAHVRRAVKRKTQRTNTRRRRVSPADPSEYAPEDDPLVGRHFLVWDEDEMSVSGPAIVESLKRDLTAVARFHSYDLMDKRARCATEEEFRLLYDRSVYEQVQTRMLSLSKSDDFVDMTANQLFDAAWFADTFSIDFHDELQKRNVVFLDTHTRGVPAGYEPPPQGHPMYSAYLETVQKVEVATASLGTTTFV